MAVTILIEDIVTNESWAYPCDRSPVIIGRARSATISIVRGFISGLHGTIRHDDQEISFTELDSLNGTLLDGQPIPTDRPVKLLPDSELILGKRLRLTVWRGTVAAPPDPTRKSPFEAESKSHDAPAVARVSTNVLSGGELDEIARARKAKEKESAKALLATPEKGDTLPAPPSPTSRPAVAAAPAAPPSSFVARPADKVSPDRQATVAASAEPDPTPEPGMLPPKTRLGRYYIVRLVARGGMGAIYRAEDPETEQAVAIKTLAPDLASKPEAQARFLREAKVACRVTHRNIIKIFGYDIYDGIPYLIMEYLRGEGLHALLDRGPLAIERTAGIGAAVCAGMSVVHEHGIIHRDLKPSNIFMADTDEGQLVKVLDFGVSKAQASRDPFRTGMNAIIGSLPYMSPEQALGGVELDARSDQFSLGVILYECLTGHRPHQGETPYTLSENIVHGRFEPPIALRPEIPAALNDVIMKSMSTAPDDRYESLRELGVDLLRFSSAQAQRQLTDLLSNGPHPMSRVQVSAPIPADWYESVKSPVGKPLPRTETGVVETGQAFARPDPIQALVGRTQILGEGAAPGAVDRWGRRQTPPTQPGALVPYAPPAAWPPERGIAPATPRRSISLWHAAAFIAAGFAMGAIALWLITPRPRDFEVPTAPDPGQISRSPAAPPAPSAVRVVPPPVVAPPVVATSPARAAPVGAAPAASAPAPRAAPLAPPPLVAAPAPVPPHRTVQTSVRPPPARGEPAATARRDSKRLKPRAKSAPPPPANEPARTKNGVRILE